MIPLPDLIDSIVNTVLFMLTNPLSRCLVRPHLDLRALIAPFTDVDADEKTQLPRLKAAKVALAAILRTWTGAVLLASDDLGLPTLIRMLRDSKVSVKAQDMLLDTIAEAFERVFAKARRDRLSSVGTNHGYKVVTMDSGMGDEAASRSSTSSMGDNAKSAGAAPVTVPPPTMEGIRESSTLDDRPTRAAAAAAEVPNTNDKKVGEQGLTTSSRREKPRRTSFMAAMNFWGGGGKREEARTAGVKTTPGLGILWVLLPGVVNAAETAQWGWFGSNF